MRHHGLMTETADVIVVGAGVQGASLAFHLARRGVAVLVLERDSVAAGATGRSSGFVRMHYDLESDARLAWASFPYFEAWAELVGTGDCGFVRTGFMHLFPAGARRRGACQHRDPAGRRYRHRRPRRSRGRGARPGGAHGRHRRGGLGAQVRLCRPVGHGGRVPRGGARPWCPVRPGLSGPDGRRSTARRSPASRPTGAGSKRRSWSMSPAPGRRVWPVPSGSRSRSTPGDTTPRSSACPPAAARTSRSSSTR